ncbi:MAG: peroxidase [Planctomycetaceae bacterium]|nr:peroxidase [Planctomycetaceae bacterium]
MFRKSTRRHSRRCTRPVISLQAETAELRQMLSATSSPIDGYGNNEQNPLWGSVDVELVRLADAAYSNGFDSLAGADRLSPRVVSNEIAAQTDSILNSRNLSDYAWVWGQFLDHDIDLSVEATPAEPISIEVPAGDPWFDPFGTGTVTIDTTRSIYVTGSESSDGLRQQMNAITAFIDGSVIYGSTQERAEALRTFSGGQLKTSEGNLLPFNSDGLANAGGTSSSLFLAGDIRANENVLLSSMHTIWVREHNRIAAELAAADSSLTDQELYEQARSLVAAEMQAITYNEFLPALLGPDALSEYTGYDSGVNPGIANEFSTAAYRFGHSLLSPTLQRLDENWTTVADGNLPLQNAFFNPTAILSGGIDSLLRGAAVQTAQELDSFVVDDVRNFLFGPPGSGGLDLASLNIMRGREHGLADYNSVREAMGLSRVSSFSEITSNYEIAARLELVYGTVDDIDLWVGGLAEDHLPESSMGATFTAIIADQFARLRAGDRYWYQNIFSGDQLQAIENTRLSDVIVRNSNIVELQTNLFFTPGSELVYVDLQDSMTRDASVEAVNDRIIVRDHHGRELLNRQVGDLGGIIVRGGDTIGERLTVSAGITDIQLPFGVDYRAGIGSGDSLAIRGTSQDDRITVDNNAIAANALSILFSDVDALLVEGRDGNDSIEIIRTSAAQVTLDGGRGDDWLIGGPENDRIFGGDGNDVLLGGDGYDSMFGGTGNDRLYGQRDWDVLIGNSGRDLIEQTDHEKSRRISDRTSRFLDQELGLRFSGNDWLNWGGRGEKWLLGRDGWYFITPDGSLYRWDRTSIASGTLIAHCNRDCFDDVRRLSETSAQFSDEDPNDSLQMLARDMDRGLGLRSTGNYFYNWGGRREKWLAGGGGMWYFITEDGRLYRWNGESGASGDLLAEFDRSFYDNPARLASAWS